MPDTVEIQSPKAKHTYTEAQRAAWRRYDASHREKRRQARADLDTHYRSLGLCPHCAGARALAPNRQACGVCNQRKRR